MIGRINQADWETDGIAPPRPDWHYAMKLLPTTIGQAETDEVLGRVTREIVEKSWIWGTPARVAEQIHAFVQKGANWVHLADTRPIVLDPDDAQQTIARTVEVARILKATTANPAMPSLAASAAR